MIGACAPPVATEMSSNPETIAQIAFARAMNASASMFIVISDTGCGTEVPNTAFSRQSGRNEVYRTTSQQPEVWNIGTFLEYTINPGGQMPYLVMTTHCHYDHIMGIGKLPPTLAAQSPAGKPPTTVLTSSHSKSFVTPYSHLQRHSLCDSIGLNAPTYDVGIWAEDLSRVEYIHTKTSTMIPTPYTILHTPGHTPDSLSWYDADLRLLCVGDSFYAKETCTTRGAKWGPEVPMPTMFDSESDVAEWWSSTEKILEFVRTRNAETESSNEWLREKQKYYLLERERQGRVVPADWLGRTEDDERETNDNDDDGFVLVETKDALDDPTDEKQSRPGPSLAQHGSESRKQNPTASSTSTQSPKSTQSQLQTGFDIPPPDQRLIIALPMAASRPRVARRLVPPLGSETAASTTRPSPLNDSEPWMLVLDRHLHCSWDPAKGPIRGDAPLPRVKLCAAHTTLSIDAEWAILAMRNFMLRILNNDGVPAKRVANNARGEEMWLWDRALDDDFEGGGENAPSNVPRLVEFGFARPPRAFGGKRLDRWHGTKDVDVDVEKGCAPGNENALWQQQQQQLKYTFSVLAPLRVIEEGRKKLCGNFKMMEGPGERRECVGRPAGVV